MYINKIILILIQYNSSLILLPKQLYYSYSSECIQSSGWLIKKQYLWLYNQLHTNVCPLPLSSTDTTNELSTNLHVYTCTVYNKYIYIYTE